MAGEAELHVRGRLGRLRGLGLLRGTRISGELARLQRQLEKISEATDEEIWQHVELARHPERPYTLDYIERIFEDFVELHGDRSRAEDPAMVTGLARFGGRTVAFMGHQKGRDVHERTRRNFGMTYPEGYRKAMRVMDLAERHRFPVISLIDTPGYIVGPDHERDALVRHCCRLLVAGAALSVPVVAIVLRRAYGLGAQAMACGGLHQPLLTAAWPGANLGGMGLEGAVRLSMRKELEAIADEAEREQRVRDLTARAYEHAKALNAAQIFELDDVIDPVETRSVIARTLTAAGNPAPSGRTIDTW